MTEENEIRVNFGRPVPIFPLATVTLLPHAVLPMHIFEPRYRQMVTDALDAAGQVAMAVFEGDSWRDQYAGRPPVRPYVCLGQIVEHQKLPDGRYNIHLHGVCRAKILAELPERDDTLYRRAMLEPVGLADGDEDQLAAFRERTIDRLSSSPLTDLRDADKVVARLRDKRLPTSAIMELICCSVLRDADMRFYGELHYALLAEADPAARATLIDGALGELGTLLGRARAQRQDPAPPKGCNWN
jgi:hypothetical protein